MCELPCSKHAVQKSAHHRLWPQILSHVWVLTGVDHPSMHVFSLTKLYGIEAVTETCQRIKFAKLVHFVLACYVRHIDHNSCCAAHTNLLESVNFSVKVDGSHLHSHTCIFCQLGKTRICGGFQN